VAGSRKNRSSRFCASMKRLRMLEDENRELKKLLAESMLDNAALKELLAKCMVRPGVARSFVLLSEAACVNV